MTSPTSSPSTSAPAPAAPVRRSGHGRRWLVRLLALALSCTIAAGLLEVMVRVAGLDVPRVWVPDPVLGWRHIPGSRIHWTEEGDGRVEINSLGHRDRLDRTEARLPGSFRIAVLGDSMTEGVQVDLEKTYCYRLEDDLSQGGRRVEVLNLGVNGFGPVQELLMLRREGPRLKPDLVILSVFLDNDIADCDPRLRSSSAGAPFGSVVNGKLEIDSSRAEQSYADYHREPTHTLRATSATYRMVRDRWQKMAAVRGAGDPAGGVPKRYRLYLKPPPPPWDDAWATFEQVLVEFAAEAGRLQARALVVNVPAGQVVSPANWQALRERTPGLANGEFDLDGPERQLAELTRKHNLPLVQPTAAFRQSGRDALYFGDVGHFTPAGHELMARVLADYLKQNALLP